MKILDVNHLETGTTHAVKSIDSFINQVTSIQRAVRDFYDLDHSLQGQSGKSIRSFFNDVHQPFLVNLHQSLIEYQVQIERMREAAKSLESNSDGLIRLDFLEHDVKNSFNTVKDEAVDLMYEANTILNRVDDLVTVKKINASKLVDHVEDGKAQVDEIIKELLVIDEHETSMLENTKQRIRIMKNYLSDMESKFRGGDISVAHFDLKDIEYMTPYQSIIEAQYDRDGLQITEVNEDTIEDLPLSVIKENMDKELKGLDSDGGNFLEHVFSDLEHGIIDRQEYLTLLKDIQKLESSEEVPESIIEYVDENKGDLGFKLADDVITQIINQSIDDPEKAAERLTKLVGTKANPTKVNDFLIKHGGKIQGLSRLLGPLGFTFGVHEDINYNDKTMGEALVHNATGLGIGSSSYGAYILLFGTNPVGWTAIAGTTTVGLGLYTVYDYAYEHNYFWVQDSVNFVGGVVQNGLDVAGNWFGKIGKSIQYNLENHQFYNWYK